VNTVLVTGGAKRIGAEICRAFHAREINVAIHFHHSGSEARALASELNQIRPDSAHTFQADLTSVQDCIQLAESVGEWTQQLLALVNNASGFYPTPMGEFNESSWQELMGSNAMGPLFLSQALHPALKRASGSILNITDVYASIPLANHTIYCMAKAANSMLTRSLALEMAPHVRVNGIAPGTILWPENDNPAFDSHKQLEDIPLARTGTPADIAATAVFLVLDAPYVTGQILAVDGGFNLAGR
jgi:pteridine reductase